MKIGLQRLVVCLFFMGASLFAEAQFLMDMIDTTKDLGKGMLSVYRRFDRIQISGYIQPQFQFASAKGIHSFAGGDFAPNSNNRFMIRRGRIRFDYAHLDRENRPILQFVFQFDGSERGVFIRDFWGRVWETKFQAFAFTMGMFARPFGYEINLGSADRETPERGRMSQTLMKVERDLGAMVSYEPHRPHAKLGNLKIDLGVFNGQGLNGPGEFDSYKDFIGQIMLKPYSLNKNLIFSGGVQYFNGGIVQLSKYYYSMGTDVNGNKMFIVDSSLSNVNSKSPRIYYGANAQLKFLHGWGATEIRGEYWQGTQTATALTSEIPGTLPFEGVVPVPFYRRKFNGAFIYFLQNIFNNKNQLVLKYYWYDPNTDVSGKDIGKPGTNVNFVNIRYNTFGIGYQYFISPNLKLVFYYDMVHNETTQLPEYNHDLKDNVFTFRMQFRF